MTELDINLLTDHGIPGTGAVVPWETPCQCYPSIQTVTSVYSVTPGEHVDFGQLSIQLVDGRDGHVPSYFDYESGVGVSWNPPIPTPSFVGIYLGDYPAGVPVPPVNPVYIPCITDGPFFDPYNCHYDYSNVPPTTWISLDYTVPVNATTVELSWIGDYTYTPPDAVPLPSAFMLLATGLGVLAIGRKRCTT